jgi:hypothetical protein
VPAELNLVFGLERKGMTGVDIHKALSHKHARSDMTAPTMHRFRKAHPRSHLSALVQGDPWQEAEVCVQDRPQDDLEAQELDQEDQERKGGSLGDRAQGFPCPKSSNNSEAVTHSRGRPRGS